LIESENNMPSIKLHLITLIKRNLNYRLVMVMCSSMLFLGLLLRVVSVYAVETPIPPSPTRWVTDINNFISVQTARELDNQLAAYQRTTGHQLLIYIDRITGGVPIEDWAVRAFAAWKVGRKGIEDGLIIFVMSEDRKVRIEVGYGLEAQVTDVKAARIINEIIVPRIQAGDHNGAIRAGIDAIMRIIGGQGSPSSQTPPLPN
jgi:uncharacterized protein